MNYRISKADFIIKMMERLIFNFVRNCKRIINEIKWIELSRAEWKRKVIQERYQSEIYGKSSIAMCIAFCGNSSGCTRYIEVRRYLRDDAFFHSHGRRKTHRLLAGVQVVRGAPCVFQKCNYWRVHGKSEIHLMNQRKYNCTMCTCRFYVLITFVRP